jgi:PEGA domain-containing protein/DnaJ-like protein
MRDTFEQSLRVLGLAPGATEQAIKEAYRDLVKVWHPDRFGSDARLRAKAQERLKEVNAAFAKLRGYRPADSRPSREAAPPVEEPQPAVVYHAKYWLTGALLLLLFPAGIVGAWLFISGGRATEQPSPPNEAVQTPTSGPTRVPAAPHPVRRGAAEPLSSADAAPESAAVPTTGSVRVGSRPMGARVSFDGRVVGETPMIVTNVTLGEHQIGLDLDGKGYQPWSSSVVVTAGHEEKLLAVMTSNERRH